MATNKHAILRYNALDKCFSNRMRKFFIDDLVEACNEALLEHTELSEGVKKRQIYDDIKFMESSEGWEIPLGRFKEGRKFYYRYEDQKFSIHKKHLNESEANKVKEALAIINEFKGLPDFSWIKEFTVRVKSNFELNDTRNHIVEFDKNESLKGLDFFNELFNAISLKVVLKIKYYSYKEKKTYNWYIHPYFLKEYNNRWFLFGYNSNSNRITNLALDRIIEIRKTKNKEYIENTFINFENYFKDVVGVTVDTNKKRERILLKISNNLYPYIKSKPIHCSQNLKERKRDGIIIELNLQLNYEFISLILSYGEDVTIIEPKELKEYIKNKAQQIYEKYI